MNRDINEEWIMPILNALTLSIVSAVDPAEFCAFLKSNALLLFFLKPATAKKMES